MHEPTNSASARLAQHLLPLEHILFDVLSQGDEILNDQDKNFAAIL